MTECREVASDVRLVLAPNPGPMTLTGTNTYVIGDPARTGRRGRSRARSIEPHLAAIARLCPAGADAIVLTHWHHDHSEAAAELARRLGCPVRSVDASVPGGGRGLADGDLLDAGGGSGRGDRDARATRPTRSACWCAVPAARFC